MQINSINNYPSFRGILSINNSLPKLVLGDKVDVLDAASTAKNLNVWILDKRNGVNKENSLSVIIVDSENTDPKKYKSGIVKELSCSYKKEDLESMRDKIEKSIIWAYAPRNILASKAFEMNLSAKKPQDMEYADQLSKDLLTVGISVEGRTWEERLGHII